jgi:hypothetical protein
MIGSLATLDKFSEISWSFVASTYTKLTISPYENFLLVALDNLSYFLYINEISALVDFTPIIL